MSGTLNPFNPGSGTDPPFLAGRHNEIESFQNSLKSIAQGKSDNIVLTGLRGTGKTVLLNEFDKVCRRSNFFPIKRLHFASKYRDQTNFYNVLKYDISTAISSLSTKEKITQKMESIGSRLKPKSVGVPGAFYYEPSYEYGNIPFENLLMNFLSHTWDVFKNNGYHGVVLMFDEFHAISDLTNPSSVLVDFIGAINELQNNGFHYHLVLTGLPKLSLIIKSARSYSERMFKPIVLKNLPVEDACLAISEPLDESPYEFQNGLIKIIAHDTGQYPYFIQFYCKELIDITGKPRIGVVDYHKAKPVIVKNLYAQFFDVRMDGLTNKDVNLLYSMSDIQSEDMRFGEISHASGIKVTSLPKYLADLDSKGLIHNHKRGVYRFSLPMFREYLLHRKKNIRII